VEGGQTCDTQYSNWNEEVSCMSSKSNWRTRMLGEDEYQQYNQGYGSGIDQHQAQPQLIPRQRPVVRTEAESETAKQIADALMTMNGIEVMGERIAEANPNDPDGLSLMQQVRRRWAEGKIQYLRDWAAGQQRPRY